MHQLLLFPPQQGLEKSYMEQLVIFRSWLDDGRITRKQWQDFRRHLEYNFILQKRRQQQHS